MQASVVSKVLQSQNQIGVGASFNRKNQGSIFNPQSATVGTVEEEAAAQPQAAAEPKQSTLHVSSKLEWGQEGWLGGGEKLPRKIWSIYFPKVSRRAGQCVLVGSCQRSYCSTKTHSSPPPSHNSGFEIVQLEVF